MPFSVNRLEAQLSSLLDVVGSVLFGCLQADITAQPIYVRCPVSRLESQLRSLLGVLYSVQFGGCRHRPTTTLVQAKLNTRLKAQLTSMLDVFVSIQFGCLHARGNTQTTSVRCSVNRVEAQLRSLLNVLELVQIGRCKHRPPPLLVHAMISKPFGCSTQFPI